MGGGYSSCLVPKAAAALSWLNHTQHRPRTLQTPPYGGSTGKQSERPKNCLMPLTVATMQALVQSHSNTLSHTSQPTLSEQMASVCGLIAAHTATDVRRAAIIETCAPCCVSSKAPTAAKLCGRSLKTCTAKHTTAHISNQVPGMGRQQQVLCLSRVTCEVASHATQHCALLAGV